MMTKSAKRAKVVFFLGNLEEKFLLVVSQMLTTKVDIGVQLLSMKT